MNGLSRSSIIKNIPSARIKGAIRGPFTQHAWSAPSVLLFLMFAIADMTITPAVNPPRNRYAAMVQFQIWRWGKVIEFIPVMVVSIEPSLFRYAVLVDIKNPRLRACLLQANIMRVFAQKAAYFAVGVIKVTENAGLSYTRLHTRRFFPLCNPVIAKGTFIRIPVFFIDESRIIWARGNA